MHSEALLKFASNVPEAEKVVKTSNKYEQCAKVEKVTETKDKAKEDDQKYTCDECEIDFISKEEFEEHLIDEHDDDTEAYLQCKKCSERMMSRTSLLTHIELENLDPDLSYKDGTIKCKKCGKYFIQRLHHTLNIHMWTALQPDGWDSPPYLLRGL